MDFKTAEGFMDEGRRAFRLGWGSTQYAYKTPVVIKGGAIEFRMTSPGDQNSTWEPSAEDREATDWIVVDDTVPDESSEQGD